MKKIKSIASVSLSHMNDKGILKIVNALGRMGYISGKDFRINYVGANSSAEMSISNIRMKKDLKLFGTLTIRSKT